MRLSAVLVGCTCIGISLPALAQAAPPGLSPLLEKIEAGEIDPSFVVTHPVGLEKAPEMYKKFREKKDGVIKVVLKPGS
jgi:threonine dehydrogenase-like Zn-dependent dehydrogenase